MRLRVVAASAAAICVAVGALPATTSAAPALRFGIIQYDGPGSDSPVTNAKLNAEVVVIRNTSARAVQLRGVTVRDAAGHAYAFGPLRLGAGKAVRLHTGKGTNSRAHRYWGQDNYIWNNSGDTARLRNATGTVIDTCRWTMTGTGKIACP